MLTISLIWRIYIIFWLKVHCWVVQQWPSDENSCLPSWRCGFDSQSLTMQKKKKSIVFLFFVYIWFFHVFTFYFTLPNLLRTLSSKYGFMYYFSMPIYKWANFHKASLTYSPVERIHTPIPFSSLTNPIYS